MVSKNLRKIVVLVLLVLFFLVCGFLVCLILCFSCREIARAQNLEKTLCFFRREVPVLANIELILYERGRVNYPSFCSLIEYLLQNVAIVLGNLQFWRQDAFLKSNSFCF